MPRMRFSLLLAAVWFAGCPKSEFVEPPDSPVDVTLFPVVAGGSRLFADVNGARLEFDPTVKDAIVALGQCVDAMTAHHPRVSLVVKADIRPGHTGQLAAKVARVEDLLADG